MAHTHPFTGHTQIILNGYPYEVVGGRIQESIINIHSRKSNQGDPGPDDHPINSTWIQRSWDGGGQIKYARPDVANNRFDWATGESMYSSGFTLPPLPTTFVDPSGATDRISYLLGIFNDQVYASWDGDLYSYNFGTGVWDLEYRLNSVPVGKGTNFTHSTGADIGKTFFYIPQGSVSDVWDGATVTAVSKSAVSFAVWDDKLFRLGTDGAVEYTTDGLTWDGLTYIPDGSTPRKLLVYMNLGGDPALHVVTSSSVYAYDFTVGRLYQTQMQYPNHPDQGRASCVWRAEMQVAVGDGVHRYNRSTIGAMGLDRDDGLPTDYRGVIVDLEPSYNSIYALVNGTVLSATSDTDAYTLNLGGGDDQMYGATAEVASLLMRWNGFGWHYVDSMNGSAPTTCVVSDANDEYAVWYAVNHQVRRIALPRVYYDPKDDATFPVRQEGFLETQWYNFGWEGQLKIAKRFELQVDRASATEIVSVEYKIDDDDNDWVAIGTVTSDEEASFFLGRLPDAPPDSVAPDDYEGFHFDRIKLRFTLMRDPDDPYARPILRWFSLIVRRFLRPNRTWRVVLSMVGKNQDYTPTELADNLYNIVLTPHATQFVHANEQQMVELVALEFRETVGPTKRAYEATVNLVESHELI